MVIIPNVHFSFRKGGGSAPEVLYGKVELKPTLAFQASTSLVLPAPTTIDLVDGEGTATNVYPTPAPVDGQIEWAYRVKVTDRHSKSFEWMVGVPDVTGTVAFTSLPKYYETRPPAFGKGDKGDPGTAATIAVGTVSSGTTPNITNAGTNTDAVLDFVLPEGPQGPPGDGFTYLSTPPQFTDPSSTYPVGSSYFVLSAPGTTGWERGYLTGVTVRRNNGRTVQTITYNDGRQFIRTDGGSGASWLPLKENAWSDLATTTANGLMSSADKSKLDNVGEVAYNTKTLSSAPSTYPEGTSSGVMRTDAGWPEIAGATFALITTSKAPSPYNSAIQWASPHFGTDSANKDTAPTLFRVGTNPDTWGAWQTTATQEVVDASKGYVTPEQFGAVGDNIADDSAAINSAIAKSIADGVPVYLEGVYYTPALGSTFWTATYEGKGGIRVGSSTTPHRPNPSNNGFNFPVYYDSNNGSDTNSGLSPNAPLKTLSAFVSRITIFMGAKSGNLGAFKLVIANGVHNDKFRSLGMFPDFSTRFYIEGESREGAILDGTGTSNEVGIWIEPGSYIGIRNLTIQNFKSPDTSGDEAPDNGAAIVHKGGGDVRVENCTIRDCSQGVGFINGTVGVLTNSIVERCQTGVRILYSSSALVTNSTIRNNTTHGVFVSRNSVTHVDYNNIEDNAVGLSVNMAARNATLGGEFARNNTGVVASGAGEVIISEATAFTGNTRDRAYYGVGRETRIHGNSPTTNEWCLHKTSTLRYHSGSTANTTVYSPGSSIMVYPRHHTTPDSKLRVKLYGLTSGPGTKTLRFYAVNPANSADINLLGTSVIDADATGEFELDMENWGVTQYGNHGRSKLVVNGKPAKLFAETNTADTTYKWSFRVMCQNSDTGGALSLRVVELYLNG